MRLDILGSVEACELFVTPTLEDEEVLVSSVGKFPIKRRTLMVTSERWHTLGTRWIASLLSLTGSCCPR